MADTVPTLLLRSEDSDGQLAVVDLSAAGGRRSTDTTSTRPSTSGTAGLAFAPRGLPHTYATLSGAPHARCSSSPRPGSNTTSPASPPSGRASSRPTGRSN